MDNNLYIVFGPKPPYTFLQESGQIIHSSEWTDYQLKHNVEIERVYIHLMTYQKIKWVSAAPTAPCVLAILWQRFIRASFGLQRV